MVTSERTASAAVQTTYQPSSRVMRALGIPAVDKTIAVVAMLPFAYELYRRATAGLMNIPRACAAAGILVVIISMLLRRAPQRVTPNPLWWLLAFVASYSPLAWSTFLPAGRPVTPSAVTNVMAISSLVIVLYSRWSLGRNIGFVPAQRQLVTSGAYGSVRHPIYSGLMISWIALALRVYSPLNAVIAVVVCALIIWKCVVEEGFLRQDAEYEAYMRRVRHRFIPGLI